MLAALIRLAAKKEIQRQDTSAAFPVLNNKNSMRKKGIPVSQQQCSSAKVNLKTLEGSVLICQYDCSLLAVTVSQKTGMKRRNDWPFVTETLPSLGLLYFSAAYSQFAGRKALNVCC